MLETSGWSINQVNLASDCWWAKEIWELKSLWTPRDKTIYLSLLIDPMATFDKNKPPDSSVWAIGLASAIPKSHLDASAGSISIKRSFDAKIGGISALAAKMRMTN